MNTKNKKLHLEGEQREDAVKIAISAVLFTLGMIFEHIVASEICAVIMFCLAYAVCGYEVLWGAAKNIVKRELFDEDLLMAIASIGALAIGEFAEAAAVMTLFKLGELFEDIAVDRSRDSITELMEIRPDKACVLRGGEEVTVSPEEVERGEIMLVRAGERVPLDGVIIEGSTSVDTSALTGEAIYAELTVGDTIQSGCVNKRGVVKAQVSSRYGESGVARILKLVEECTEKKAKAESFITRFARVYTPIVTLCAVLLAVLPTLFVGNFSVWLYRALSFLVVSCPCALVISVPLSFFGAIGGASRHGVLIKGSDSIERLANVKTAVFDKTGTLTRGVFAVIAVHPSICSEEELLYLAASVERYSDHPIARSIVDAHEGADESQTVDNITEEAGFGVTAHVGGKRVAVGNAALMEKEGVGAPECGHTHNGTIVHVCVDGEYAGHIEVDDELKPDSENAIAALAECGVSRTVILTGDSEKRARSIREAVCATECIGGLLPDQKVREMEKLTAGKAEKEYVMFVGDGINDAPAMVCADVGISMGLSGSDAAIEASDVVLTDDKPSKLAWVIALSRKTMRIVKENIVFSIAIKLAVLVLAALGLAPIWLAVFADVGVMILAVLNASRTLRGVK